MQRLEVNDAVRPIYRSLGFNVFAYLQYDLTFLLQLLYEEKFRG